MTKPPKRPRDPNQLAKAVVDMATMDEAELAEFRRSLPQRPETTGGASVKSNSDAGDSGGSDSN